MLLPLPWALPVLDQTSSPLCVSAVVAEANGGTNGVRTARGFHSVAGMVDVEPVAAVPEAPSCSSIHESVLRQDRRSVAWYLQRVPECVVSRDDDQRTPLLLAAASGDAPTCQLLLRRMAAHDPDAINWADAGGLTPLHWALTQQRYDAAALLLRHGASSTAEDEDGRRPLHAAAFSGNARCVSLLLPHVSREGASAPSADNLTPLHYAALSGSAPVVSLLLEAGASLHAVDEEGRSALSWAAGEGHAGVVAALLGAKADPAVADANGMGPLHHAAKAGSLQCSQLLLAAGASSLLRSVGGSLAEDIARQAGGRSAATLVELLTHHSEAEAQQRQDSLLAELYDPPSHDAAASKEGKKKKGPEKKKRQAARRAEALRTQQQQVKNYTAVATAAAAHFNDPLSSDDEDDVAAEAVEDSCETDRSNAPTTEASSEPSPATEPAPRLYDASSAHHHGPRSPRARAREDALGVSAGIPEGGANGVQPAWQTPRPPADRPKADWSIPSPRTGGTAAKPPPPPPPEPASASRTGGGGGSSTGALKSRPGMRTLPALPPLGVQRSSGVGVDAVGPVATTPRPEPAPPGAQTPGRGGPRNTAALYCSSPSGALTARSSRHTAGAPPPPQPLSPQTGHRQRPSYEAAPPAAAMPPPVPPLPMGASAQWPSRMNVATPQSVSSWLKDANVEQRRALAQFLTQLGPGAAASEKAAARARQLNGGSAGETGAAGGRGAEPTRAFCSSSEREHHPSIGASAEGGERGESGGAGAGGQVGGPTITSLYELRTGKGLAASLPPYMSVGGAAAHSAGGTAHGADEQPQKRIGRVRVRSEHILGKGRTGSVICMGAFEGKKAAVKVVPKTRKASGGSGAAAAAALIAAREAELMDLCENENAHPNVLRLFGCEEDATSFYLAQELCVASLHDLIGAVREPATLGGSKRQLLTRLGLWPPPLQQSSLSAPLRKMLTQLLDGLAHLHALGILHCKLRPGSVLINSHGVVKLSGLGLGKATANAIRNDSRQAARDAIATDGFDPPEALRSVVHGDDDERPTLSTAAKQSADIFSAGVLIFWCLTAGRHPFGEEPSQRRANVLRGEASALGMLRKLPEAQHLVTRMLAPEAEARLQAAQCKAHPALWEDDHKLLFVRCVSDEPELTNDRSPFVATLEQSGVTIFGNDGWGGRLHAELLQVLVAHRSYQYGSVRDLLRAVRNCDHMQGMPPEVQRLLLPRPAGIANYFLPRFPLLFWTLYSLAEAHWPARSVFEPFFRWGKEGRPSSGRTRLVQTPEGLEPSGPL